MGTYLFYELRDDVFFDVRTGSSVGRITSDVVTGMSVRGLNWALTHIARGRGMSVRGLNWALTHIAISIPIS